MDVGWPFICYLGCVSLRRERLVTGLLLPFPPLTRRREPCDGRVQAKSAKTAKIFKIVLSTITFYLQKHSHNLVRTSLVLSSSCCLQSNMEAWPSIADCQEVRILVLRIRINCFFASVPLCGSSPVRVVTLTHKETLNF
jgi:hypothetical protein